PPASPSPTGNTMSRLHRAFQKAAFLISLLLLWALAARFGPWPHALFPGPAEVGRTLARLLASGKLAAATARSVGRLLQGYAISVAIGVPLGILTARIRLLRR